MPSLSESEAASQPAHLENISPLSPPLRALLAAEMPREKLTAHGAASLTDAELLALFFGTGTRGVNVVEMSRLLLARYGTLQALSRLEWQSFCSVPGIGEAKAKHLAAAFELGKRLARQSSPHIPLSTPAEVAALVAPDLRAESREVIRIILLNTKLRFQHMENVALGSINECTARIAELLRPAIVHTAHSLILVHNHPSGDPHPSQADLELTRRLHEACRLLGLRLQDHLIIGLPRHPQDPGFFSFRESGLI